MTEIKIVKWKDLRPTIRLVKARNNGITCMVLYEHTQDYWGNPYWNAVSMSVLDSFARDVCNLMKTKDKDNSPNRNFKFAMREDEQVQMYGRRQGQWVEDTVISSSEFLDILADIVENYSDSTNIH